MKICPNGAPRDVNATALCDVLTELGYTGPAFATAVNGTFVPVSARDATVLGEGDRLEVVSPMQGG